MPSSVRVSYSIDGAVATLCHVRSSLIGHMGIELKYGHYNSLITVKAFNILYFMLSFCYSVVVI